MAITDAQFKDWIRDPLARRVYLLESSYEDGGTVNVYMSTRPYQSAPGDTISNRLYLPRITAMPQLVSALPDNEWLSGIATSSAGMIFLQNDDGALDAYLDGDWSASTYQILAGDASWSRDDFRNVYAGKIRDAPGLENGGTALTLELRGTEWVRDAIVSGGTTDEGVNVPVCYGGELTPAQNIEPVLIDAVTHRYKYDPGPCGGVSAARVSGVAASFTNYGSDGEVTLAATPTGQVTLDVFGRQISGAHAGLLSEIVELMLLDHTDLLAADIDVEQVGGHGPAHLYFCYYARDAIPLADALADLLSGLGYILRTARDGKVKMHRHLSGGGSLDLSAAHVDQRSIRARGIYRPYNVFRFGFNRNWTIQEGSALAASVTEANRAKWGRRNINYDDSLSGASSTAPDVIMDSCFTHLLSQGGGDAHFNAEDNAAAIRERKREWTYTATVPVGLWVAVGGTVTVTGTRLPEQPMVIKSIVHDATRERTTLTVFES